jgi:alkanesulfonate monooxygenase SsuD/methylene tetrahydromethanopterin reductase-like flavin-dependent oxidoreductase (luciferase family)
MQFWSGTAFMGSAEALAVARMLDEAGYDGVICADHLIYPRNLTSPYPSLTGRPMWSPETGWPDSWILIGAMAAVTRRLRFSNAVYVAPARPLLEVAKQVATASVISDGRVSLAVGAGWMREEFELLGQDFGNRGKRLDEMIPALRALWQGGWVSWSGALLEPPSVDLYRRAEDLGITAVMCAPWAGAQDVLAGDHEAFHEFKHPAERYRPSIERFAQTVIDKFR